MKKILLLLYVCLLLTFSVNAQSGETAQQTAVLTELARLNSQVVALFGQKNYDEALKIALDVRSLAEKNNLAKDARVLPYITNLAEIYLSKSKESEALTVYHKVLEDYRTVSVDTRAPVAKIAERMATIYYFKKDYDKAGELFLKALPLRESLNPNGRELVIINNALGDIYRRNSQNAKADLHYRRAIEINDRILSREEKKDRQDLENYECFVYHRAFQEGRMSGASGELKAFRERREPPRPDRAIDSGIVNGKAIKLVKPFFPSRMRGYDGFVLVRVTIDEQGAVIAARTTCGIKEFVSLSEEAARKSKFSPTLVKGEPVKVTGVIVYNFKG